jgi:hypothetical protein
VREETYPYKKLRKWTRAGASEGRKDLGQPLWTLDVRLWAAGVARAECHLVRVWQRIAMGAAPAPPTRVVAAFYRYHFTHDMAFTPTSVGVKRAWLAPELLDLCKAYFKKPVPADDVPEIDGDPFTDSQEYPKLFRVGPPAHTAHSACGLHRATAPRYDGRARPARGTGGDGSDV